MKYLNRLNLIGFFVFCFGAVALFAYLTANTHFADSEIWSISSTRFFPWDLDRSSYFFKFAFHAFLKPVYFLNLDSLDTILFARYQFLIVGIALASITFLLGKKTEESFLVGFISLFLLITSSLFISRGFRVRSDLLCALFFYVCLYINLFHKKHESIKIFSIYCISLALMFLSTPTSLLFCALLLVQPLIYFLKNEKTPKFLFIQHRTTLLVPCSLIFITSVLVILSPKAEESFLSIAEFARNSFVGPRSFYLMSPDFYHFFHFFNRSPIFTGLIALSTLYILISFKKNPERTYLYSLHILSLFMVVFFPNKRPFFLVTFLPIFAITSALFLNDFKNIVEKKLGSVLAILILVILAAGPLYTAQKHVQLIRERNLNHDQRVMINHLESFISSHNIKKYYDGFGVLPRSNFLPGFIGPEQGKSNIYTVESVIVKKPEIILYTGKLSLARELIIPLILNHYTPLGYNIWAKAHTVSLLTNYFPMMYIENNSYKLLDKKFLRSLSDNFITEWKYVSATYRETSLPKHDGILQLNNDGKIVKFNGTTKLSTIDGLLVPETVRKIRLSQLPVVKIPGVKVGFNGGFLFDIRY